MAGKFWIVMRMGVVAGVLAAAAPGVLKGEVRLEDPGTPRRAQQDAMVYKAFDSGLLSSLTSWSTEKGVDAEAIQGKVVLIVTWSGWHKPGDAAVRLAQSMHEQYSEKGLVVVGAHNARGFEKAKEHAERLGVKFAYANDEKGTLRSGLKLDQDPDFVLIDRAGNMRYVDVETGSVRDGVEELIGETKEGAAAKPGELAAKKEKDRKAALKTRDVSGLVAPGQELVVEFEMPEREMYDKVRWPSRVRGTGKYEFDKLSDKFIYEPPSMTLPEEEGYKPFAPKTTGKIRIVYFVDPKIRQMLNVLPTMNSLQDRYKRDAVVIGVSAKFGVEAFNLDDERINKLLERNEPFVDEILRTRPMNHAILYRTKVGLDKINGISSVFGNSIDDIAVCVVLSTEGVIRWIGHPAEEGLKVVMDGMINVDPGVRARRTAEDKQLRLEKSGAGSKAK